MKATRLRKAVAESASLQQSLLRCVNAFLIQTTETALANGRSKNEERLARWLLMADDRIDGGEVPLTHKLLGVMLGVQRSADRHSPGTRARRPDQGRAPRHHDSGSKWPGAVLQGRLCPAGCSVIQRLPTNVDQCPEVQ